MSKVTRKKLVDANDRKGHATEVRAWADQLKRIADDIEAGAVQLIDIEGMIGRKDGSWRVDLQLWAPRAPSRTH